MLHPRVFDFLTFIPQGPQFCNKIYSRIVKNRNFFYTLGLGVRPSILTPPPVTFYWKSPPGKSAWKSICSTVSTFLISDKLSICAPCAFQLRTSHNSLRTHDLDQLEQLFIYSVTVVNNVSMATRKTLITHSFEVGKSKYLVQMFLGRVAVAKRILMPNINFVRLRIREF